MRHLHRPLIWTLSSGLLLGSACHKDKPAPPPPPAPVAAPAPPPAPPPPPDPFALEDAKILHTMDAVFTCFDKAMEASKEKDAAFARYQRNPFTDMFVFHALVEKPAQLDQDVNKLCDAVVARYRRAFLAELGRRPAAKRPKDEVSPDTAPAFVRETHDQTGLHVFQHGDITRAAARQVFGARLAPALELVVFGAQQPDLYNKEDSRFHALYHRATVVGHLTELFGKFAEAARQDRAASAALHLGAVCHLVQDAAFYRGMTVENLAGLLYYTHQDPYGPAAVADATRLTKYALGLARAGVNDEKAWQRFLAWTPPEGLDMAAALRSVFGRTVPVDVLALTRQWLFNLTYQRFPERRAELANGAAGLARWDADLFVAEGLGPGGVAQPGAGPERAARRAAPSRPR